MIAVSEIESSRLSAGAVASRRRDDINQRRQVSRCLDMP
jgi:hypothetical protein